MLVVHAVLLSHHIPDIMKPAQYMLLPRLLPSFFDELDEAYEDLQEVEQRVEREVEDVDFDRRLDFADHRVRVVPNYQTIRE